MLRLRDNLRMANIRNEIFILTFERVREPCLILIKIEAYS